MKIVFLTGAGIDQESGIPTFRDNKTGLWENHDVKDVASISGWEKNKELVLKFYNERRRHLDNVEPNEAHKMIAELEKTHDVSIITTNVSDLHERSGSTNILHLHGELNKMCSSYNKELTLPFNEDIKMGDLHSDGSQLRPYIVWFGENVPAMSEAIRIVKTADIFVIVGTSLEVYPAAGLMGYAKADCKMYYIDPKPKMNEGVLQYFTVIKSVATKGVKKFIKKISEKNGK